MLLKTVLKGETRNRYIFIGIDPGTTVGIAVLSIKGELVAVFSIKSLEFKELVKIIYSFGKPIIIATDIPISSSTVFDLCRITGSKLYYPNKKYNSREKTRVINKFVKLRTRLTPHERDALFAVIKAYNHYSNKIKNIEKRLKSKNIEINEEIIAKVLHGTPLKDILIK